MEAFEFNATPENGIIKIPEKYRKRITSGVKVIILITEKNGSKKNVLVKSDLLAPPAYDTTGWKFNREEANAR